MKNIVSCPECRRALQVPEDFFGRTVQCPDCKHMFAAKPPDAPIAITSVHAEPSPPTVPAAVPPSHGELVPPSHGELVPRPPRQWHDDDDMDAHDPEDMRIGHRMDSGAPDRGGIILALGIVSLVLASISFILYIVPVWIVPLVVGIFGWVMGQRDLRAIRERRMQQSGHVMTLVGMILSIVGVGISVCVGLFSCSMLAILGFILFAAANAPPPPVRPGR
jgi:hypothetical protein